MANKMLIDAAHPEETRVVVLRGNRIEEFDFEAANRKQLRGNIYLAKVTRVEPSLQAAFIEYGGNRHGFLAFAEIHPDYYQIPVADRQALLEDEARSHADDDEDSRSSQGGRRSRRHRRGENPPAAARRAVQNDEAVTGDGGAVPDEATADPRGGDDPSAEFGTDDGPSGDADAGELTEMAMSGEAESGPVADEITERDSAPAIGEGGVPLVEEVVSLDVSPEDEGREVVFADDGTDDDAAQGDDEGFDEVTTIEGGLEAAAPAEDEHAVEVRENGHENGHDEDVVEQLGGDALEDVPHRVSRPRRNYKIQEVIKRRQVLLVQVVKEERGNKGAALTTYLSLAGRYSVLMPNTARGGGISRKITDAEDRKRLKAIAQELDVPDGMGIILRTAGAARGIAEVKRDFEYLMRMWETVRETTLRSSAPTLVYEEGSLIKRSLRDLFTKDVDEVIVAGDEAYREAKDFMRLLMPGQSKAVVAYRDPQPIFAKAGAEAQLDAMFSSQVTLRSGGYLVINQTEALVAIDVNSGRSTREHNIEDTALRTNLEAADEIARQLRLRDLAGLIVVDFIDMEEGRNDRAVERRMKDALKDDRARIQIGRISHFGLLEMSRQRMRTGVLEGSTVMCPHCAGTGTVRSMSSIALHVLRLIEDALIKSAAYNLIVRTRTEVALYILNQKRANLLDLETRFGVTVTLLADVNMTGAVYHAIERGTEATPPLLLSARGPVPQDEDAEVEDEIDEGAAEELEDEGAEEMAVAGSSEQPADGQPRARDQEGEGGRRRKRRRRRRGGREGQNGFPEREANLSEQTGQPAGDEEAESAEPEGLEHADLTDIAAGFAPVEAEQDSQVVTAPEPAGLDRPDREVPAEADGLPLAGVEQPQDLREAAVVGETDAVDPVQAESVEPGEPDAAEPPRRRRSRRPARTAEAEPATADVTDAEQPAPAKRPRRSRARPAEVAPESEATEPSADRDVGADKAKNHTESTTSEAEPELPLAAAAGEQTPVIASANTSDAVAPEPAAAPAEPDPDRPKRSGWWQRAKATFSTGT